MSYKPDEGAMMAYLYGELEGSEKEKFEQFLLKHEEARAELEKLKGLRSVLSYVEDKEVLAPPIFIDNQNSKRNLFFQSTPFKTIIGIAASLLLLLMVGKMTDTRIQFSGNEFKMSFGEVEEQPVAIDKPAPATAVLTANEVQAMINHSLSDNISVMQASFDERQEKLNASIQKNLMVNSNKIDKNLRLATLASQEQIQQYVSSLQTGNMELVKDYFTLTSNDQKQYIEDLLVDFAKYLQQQRNDDLMLMQTRLNSLEQNTDMFKQETEQILSSIITNANVSQTTRN
jgi:hypothetical protein